MAARGEVDKEEGNNSGFMGEYGERGRYRNRVEFKAYRLSPVNSPIKVDIETEWNLKFNIESSMLGITIVDIETEWNLKQERSKGI